MLTYNIGARQEKAFSSDLKKAEFTKKLAEDVRKITDSCDVACFQEVNATWQLEIRKLLPRGSLGRCSLGGGERHF